MRSVRPLDAAEVRVVEVRAAEVCAAEDHAGEVHVVAGCEADGYAAELRKQVADLRLR